MRISDWSSDVCSSDLAGALDDLPQGRAPAAPPVDRGRVSAGGALHAVGLRRGVDAALRQLHQGHLRAVPRLAGPLDGRGAGTGAGGGDAGGALRRVPHPALDVVPPPPRSEEHTSELQSLMRTSYAVFCLKK